MLLTENMVVAERFKLSKMIGRGGMGSVWQAADLRLNTTCAVKFIEGEMAHLAEAHARFQREAQAAAQLRSPHVVQIFDHGVWQDHPYIAMELLDGEDLGKRLTAHGGRLPSAAVNVVIQQVCRALSKAHAAGVVHRDLKPDNIFLVTDDDREIVKILDFGVAKSAGQALDGSNTKTGAMLGTPYYMSPEQAQGIKSVDSRSDLWSLAVIVFQCVTGRLPFESEALGDLLVKIIVNPIPVPSAFNAALPGSFDTWWTKAADRNPDNRFQSAKAFAESLSIALGESVGPTTDPRLARPVAGGTAIMSNDLLGRGVGTPMPGSLPGPLPSAPQGGPHPMLHTPPRPPSYGGVASAATGNPIAGTFPGIEPSTTPPKKATPLALFVGLGLVLLVGLGLGGAAVLARGRSAQGSTGLASSAVGVSIAAVSATSSDPAPKATASAEPPTHVEVSAAASAKDPEPVASAAASAASSARRAPVAAAPPTPPAKPVVKPATAPTASAPKRAGAVDLGF